MFADVSRDDWYYDAVKYVYNKELFKGTEAGFSPERTMTRAMLVTVLYRTAPANETAYKNPFKDVAGDSWYTEGILWASENGLVKGISEDSFAPDSGITREQLAIILYRYASAFGYDTDMVGEYDSYIDAGTVSDYAKEAMRYAIGAGILKGSDGYLDPKREATRAEVATMLMRFLEGNRK